MINRTCRDWRGIKHHLTEYSTSELICVLHNTEDAREQLTRFQASVLTELRQREAWTGPRAA